MILRRLGVRNRQPELMDQAGLDPILHRQALRGLERINRLSRSSRILWPAIWKLAKREAPRPIRVLDIACGAGDVTLALAEKARRNGLPIQFTGCDISPLAVEHATAKANELKTDVHFEIRNIFQYTPPVSYDVVCCSLFLHHLDEADAIALLQRMKEIAGHLVLVNDLTRSITGYLLAYFGVRVLSRSPIVHVDGPRSVEGAFTLTEALALAERSGLHGACVKRRWPSRFLLRWSPP
ncbi:MAG: methyltransferase domain-containing protein [Planctomycetes bacterium]|nr:methyltransferase domain-containing protein [Planctomycetota bacterium]